MNILLAATIILCYSLFVLGIIYMVVLYDCSRRNSAEVTKFINSNKDK